VRLAAEVCVRLTACTPPREEAHFRDPSACVAWWLEDLDLRAADPWRACLVAARTCADVRACGQGGGHPRAAAFCAARPGVASGCEGDLLVSCGDDATHDTTVVSCAEIGAVCRETKAAGGIVLRACVSSEACPAGAPESRCDGEAAI